MAERNMDMNKCPMPVQDPDVRNKNFDEVALGYTYDMAVNEARRCLNCKNKPCVSACPVQINIPAFIERVANEDIEGAFAILSESTSLPAVCGRVCPQENQCEGKCVRGIKGEPVGIGRLERFVADYHREHCTDAPVKPEPNGHKVAVIGAGPSGLTVAGDLAKLGYKVTIFEALHLAGGVLVYGIPEFRLPKAIVQKEIDNLKAIGVDVETNMVIGKVLTIDEIFEMGNEAIFVGSGAGLPRFMNIPGESLKGVYSANEFLTRINLMKAYRDGSKTPIQHAKKVAVVGGGNVAMDAARTAKRNGAEEVYVAYRRDFEDMTATKHEISEAIEEGILFKTFEAPVEIVDDGIILARTEKKEVDGKSTVGMIPDSEYLFECDSILIAVSQAPKNTIVVNNKGVDTTKRGHIETDEKGHTTKEGVFACGDVVLGASTVIQAVNSAKIVSESMDEYLQEITEEEVI